MSDADIKLSDVKEGINKKYNLLFGIMAGIFVASLCVALFFHNQNVMVEAMFGCLVCLSALTCWRYDCYTDFEKERKIELKDLLKK